MGRWLRASLESRSRRQKVLFFSFQTGCFPGYMEPRLLPWDWNFQTGPEKEFPPRDAETQREKIHSPLCVSASLRENPSLT